MRIGILVHKCSGGGAERIAGEVSRMLDDQGHTIFFCTFFQEDQEYPYAGERISLPAKKSRAALTLIRRIKWVRRVKADYGLDIMISFLPQANLINLITGGRSLVSFRNNPDSIPWPYRMAFRHSLGRAETIVAISHGVARAIKDQYKATADKVHVVYNPLKNFERETPSLRPLKRILSVGRLTEQKAHHRTIAAFEHVAKTRLDVRLRIIGKGPLQGALEAQAAATGLGDRIEIIPFTYAIEEEYRQADLLVLASRYEGFGNVILEAMAKGCPVIATDCPYGPREIIAPETPIGLQAKHVEIHAFGLLVPIHRDEDHTIRDLAAAMVRVMDDDELRARLNQAGPKRTQDFRGEEIGQLWRRLINP